MSIFNHMPPLRTGETAATIDWVKGALLAGKKVLVVGPGGKKTLINSWAKFRAWKKQMLKEQP
jgi:hypothetical protein